MANLTRWDPFREMNALRTVMDQMVHEGSGLDRFWNESSNSYGLALDVSENENEYTVKASVPGVNPDDLDISLNDNMLTIRGEIKDESEKEEKGQYHLRERHYGSFMRSVSLPATIDSQQASADFENGVLTLHLPKSAETKPRRISVGNRQTIDADSGSSTSNPSNAGSANATMSKSSTSRANTTNSGTTGSGATNSGMSNDDMASDGATNKASSRGGSRAKESAKAIAKK